MRQRETVGGNGGQCNTMGGRGSNLLQPLPDYARIDVLHESIVVREILTDDDVGDKDDWWHAQLLKKEQQLLLLAWPEVLVTQILNTDAQHAAVEGHTNLAEVESLMLTLALNVVVLAKVFDLECRAPSSM